MAHVPHPRLSEDAFKGVVITSFLTWFRENFGEARLARAFEKLALSEALPLQANHASFNLLPSAWYGAEPVHAMVESLLHGMAEAERRKVAERAGRQVFLRLISGIYAGLYRAIASPTLYARYAPRLWSSSYRLGEIHIQLVGPGEIRVETRAWPGHHPFLCDMNTATAAPIFEGMGCLEVEVTRPRCVAQGDTACELDVGFVAGL